MRQRQQITLVQLRVRIAVWERYREKFPGKGELPRLIGIDSRKASCVHSEGSGLQNLNPDEVLKLQALDPCLATPDELKLFASMMKWDLLLPQLEAVYKAARSGNSAGTTLSPSGNQLPKAQPFDVRTAIDGMVIDTNHSSIVSLLQTLGLTQSMLLGVVRGEKPLPQESCMPFFRAAILRVSPEEMLSISPAETAALMYPQYLAARNEGFDELRFICYREALPKVPLLQSISEIFYEICAAMDVWGLGPLGAAIDKDAKVKLGMTDTVLKNVRRAKYRFQHQLGVRLVTHTQGRIPVLRLLGILPENYHQALWGPMRWEEMRIRRELGPRPPVGIDWSQKPNPTVRLSNFARESILSGIRETLGAKASRWVKSVEEAFHPISESAAIFFVRTGPADLNLRNFLHFIASTRHEILYPVLLYLQRERNGGKPPVVEAPPAADETDD